MSILTADVLEGFAAGYLSWLYDHPTPSPAFHSRCWQLYLTDHPFCSIVAPREHAKSTALTNAFVTANIAFRQRSFVVIVSATEKLASDHLTGIKKHFSENDDLRIDFGVKGMAMESQTEVIVEFEDGHQAKIVAKGSGQKMRGLVWNGKRPDLVIGDDLEEDEQVQNIDRRKNFRQWVNRALLPIRAKHGIVRIHGTILHEDSFLSRIQKAPSWKCLFFKAHEGFDDFSNILWPEQWPEERLRQQRQIFIDDNDAAGYSQEYLNSPLDSSEAYLRKEWFLGMEEADYDKTKRVCIATDFAISKKDHANRTSFTVGGMDSANILHILDQHVDKMDATEIIDSLFNMCAVWNPEFVWVESGQIWLTLQPIFRKEMEQRGVWINFVERTSTKDKASRGRSLQRRMRNGGMRFDKSADWYLGYEDELIRFTAEADALRDDQFDSTALLSLGFDDFEVETEEEFDEIMSEDDWYEQKFFGWDDGDSSDGRNAVTGY